MARNYEEGIQNTAATVTHNKSRRPTNRGQNDAHITREEIHLRLRSTVLQKHQTNKRGASNMPHDLSHRESLKGAWIKQHRQVLTKGPPRRTNRYRVWKYESAAWLVGNPGKSLNMLSSPRWPGDSWFKFASIWMFVVISNFCNWALQPSICFPSLSANFLVCCLYLSK